MKAMNLNCPNCGAAISSDSSQCRYCESKVATIACSSCFGMMFKGSRHCPHCGELASFVTAAELSVLKCPRCRIDMSAITLGTNAMRECEKCEGLWVEVAAFERICADREQQSGVLGVASTVPARQTSDAFVTVTYQPCPQCAQLMNRVNFARCSGVIVDVCRGHGTWFDRDELRRIIEFIRAGGLDLSRDKEKREIEYERQQLRTEQMLSGPRSEVFGSFDDERIGGLSAARGLLTFLIKE
jgi:Zn-finger nucleic acid-binding protein